MTRLEYLNCRVLTADTGREAPDDGVVFYHRAGWSDAAIENYRARFGNFGKRIHALPDSYRRIGDGEVLRIGQHDWRVIVGTGHSPEHACLYCPELKLLISGDQVLPRISSNVSVHPTEPDENPMADWLASLDKIKARGARRRAGAALAQRSASAACMRGWTTWPRRSCARWRGCASRWPNRSARSMSSARCSRAPSAKATPAC